MRVISISERTSCSIACASETHYSAPSYFFHFFVTGNCHLPVSREPKPITVKLLQFYSLDSSLMLV